MRSHRADQNKFRMSPALFSDHKLIFNPDPGSEPNVLLSVSGSFDGVSLLLQGFMMSSVFTCVLFSLKFKMHRAEQLISFNMKFSNPLRKSLLVPLNGLLSILSLCWLVRLVGVSRWRGGAVTWSSETEQEAILQKYRNPKLVQIQLETAQTGSVERESLQQVGASSLPV